jgi:glycerophosphoryl diester phosphodiesterase
MAKIFGHRGSRGEEPENTLLGIKKAFENNAAGVEIDIHLTKDGELVIIHDDTVDRTTNGKGNVIEMTLEEIKNLDAGKGEKIPTLQEAIDVIKEAGKEIAIELKCDNAEEKVVEAIVKNDMLDKAIVKSFTHSRVKRVKEINNNIRTSCLFSEMPGNIFEIAEENKAGMLSIKYTLVDKELVDKCHAKGLQVFAWNINDKEGLKKYKGMGADYIGTDYPSKIIP